MAKTLTFCEYCIREVESKPYYIAQLYLDICESYLKGFQPCCEQCEHGRGSYTIIKMEKLGYITTTEYSQLNLAIKLQGLHEIDEKNIRLCRNLEKHR